MRIVGTFRIGDNGTLHETIEFDFSEVNFMMSDAHSTMSSFVFSETQKNENSDLVSFSISISFSFNNEVFSFIFSFEISISEFQKKDNSETVFVRGDTGDSMSFLGGVIRRDTTC